MNEILPLALGTVVGISLMRLPARLAKPLFPIACILAGVVASAVNGELATEGWLFFISIDSLVVWAGATVAVVVGWWVNRTSARR